MKEKSFSPIFYKVINPDKKLWYGTFKTKDEAEKHMKKNFPNDEHNIIEIDIHGQPILKQDK